MTIHREKLEQDVLRALKEHLMEPELCAVFCDAFTKHMNKLRCEHDAATDHYRRELTTEEEEEARPDGRCHRRGRTGRSYQR